MANELGLTIKVGFDDSGLKKANQKIGAFLKTGLSVGGQAAVAALGAVGAAATAAAGEAIAFAEESNAAMDKFKRQTGLSQESVEAFSQSAKEIFSEGVGADIADVTETMAEIANIMQSGAEETEQLTRRALGMRDTFDKDVGESIDAAKVLMDEFGISSDEAFDFMAEGIKRGLDRNGDLLDSIREYGNLFGQSGASASQFFSLLETGAAGGALGTDKAADAFKEFTLRFQDLENADVSGALGTIFGEFMNMDEAIENSEKQIAKLEKALKKAARAETPDPAKIKELENNLAGANNMLQLQIENQGKFRRGFVEFEGGFRNLYQQIQDGSLTTADAFQLVIEGINAIEDPLERQSVGVALLGTQFEDLGADAVGAFDLSATSIDEMDGSMDKVLQKTPNIGKSMDTLKRQLTTSLEPAAQTLLPLLADGIAMAGQFLTQARPIFSGFATDLSNTLGPAVTIIGDSLARVSEVLGITSEGAGGLDAALAILKGTLDLVVTGIEAVAVATSLLADAFEQAKALSDQLGQISAAAAVKIGGTEEGGLFGRDGALNFFGFQQGGIVGQTGLALVHRGEEVANPEIGQAIVIGGEQFAVREANRLATAINNQRRRDLQALVDTIAEAL